MIKKLRILAMALLSISVFQATAETKDSNAKASQTWAEIPESADEPDEATEPDSKSALSADSKKEGSSQANKDKASQKAGRQTEEISATVRLIRAQPETEVFFKDYKHSLIIPKDSSHNAIYELCESSRKTGAPVKLSIDPITRTILSPQKSSGNADGVSTP